MACNGADGDGRTAPGANALIETNDVTILPSFQVVVSDDHVGGFDKGELQVLIGFFLKVAVMELATGTGYPGCGAAIGGKGIGMGEPGDVPTSRSMTMERISPTPGRVLSSWIRGVS